MNLTGSCGYQSPHANRRADRRVSGCRTNGTCRLPADCASALSSAATEIRCDGALSFEALSAEYCVLVDKPKRSVSRAEFISRTLNAPTNPCQISLRPMAGTRAHPRPRQWPWLAGGGYASCPLLQRCSPKFLPLGCAHSSRNQETPVCPVLHFVAALRVQRCKPLP
jgi:hypothetical protein